ncbi:hypothetical protein [Candidatus Nitrososphaera sp. FF02]
MDELDIKIILLLVSGQQQQRDFTVHQDPPEHGPEEDEADI